MNDNTFPYIVGWFISVLLGIWMIIHSGSFESEQKVQIDATLVSKSGVQKDESKDQYKGVYLYKGSNITVDISLTEALNEVVGKTYKVTVKKYELIPSLQTMHSHSNVFLVIGWIIIILLVVVPICAIVGTVPDF